MTLRTICVVTGSRAEYGLLQPLMGLIRDDPELRLQVIATGMHLATEFGLTYRQIEEDGFNIDVKLEMLLSSDSEAAIAKSIGIGTMGFADCLQRLCPDIIVLLGDRFEIFACAQAAMCLRIPVAHIHGGEASEGAIDEAIRHSITKMSQLHFVAAAPYERRVIQLGEEPRRVFNVGALAADNIRHLKLMDRDALQAALGFPLAKQNFLITYHPATLIPGEAQRGMRALLDALESFPDAHLIFTMPNADSDGRQLIGIIEEFVKQHPGRALLYPSLGQHRYLSMLAIADAVIGNSSSGLIEAPLLCTPTVNIGDRQRGRLRTASVIDCAADREAIRNAIAQTLSPQFKSEMASLTSPYGNGDAAQRILQVLKTTVLEGLITKRFYDLPVN